MKRKRIFIPLVISLVLVLSLLSLGADGCPTSNKYNLTTNVSPTEGGSVLPSGGSYDPGVNVTITATANSGYVFDYWSGSASGTSPTTTVVMDAHKSVTANFTPQAQTYTLTTSVSPSGAGSVSPSGGEYDAGSSVSLSATANSGYAFDYWSGSASGTSPSTTIVMDSDKSVIANFVATGPALPFADDFSQDTGDWDIYSDSSGQVFYEGGWLHLLNYATAASDTYTLVYRYLDDFILEVETKLVDGTDDNWQTVLCRVQDEDNYYAFGVSADGYYDIVGFFEGEMIVLASLTYSGYINQGVGAVNLIHIECVGSSLTLAVNGYVLEQVTDNSVSGGYIGLEAQALSGTFTEIAFDNLIVVEPSAGPTVLFFDDFSQDTGDWDIYSDSSGQVFYESGWLHLIHYTDASLDTYTLAYQYLDDFILEVETKLVDGTDNNWQTVLCRVQDEDNYYAFGVSADGYYNLAKFIDGEPTYLVYATYSDYINQGWDVVNTVYIECIGSSLTLAVNGYVLDTVTDYSFYGGYIGFIANSLDGSFTEIAFDNLIVVEP
ncbi:MAG: hypothetical protein MUO17_03355 [Dehalococcoidales bacterium]|nr:hypothetical protein [Dehalococcoidales bacterium]